MFSSKKGEHGQGPRSLKNRDDERTRYVQEHSTPLTPVQEKLREATKQVRYSIMLGSADMLQLLANTVRAIGGKKTLDVGVYTGYSALTIAMALPQDGKVVALDVSEEFANVGRPFWKEAGVAHKIDLRIAPAMESLEKLVADGESGTFDFAFVDADKLNYPNYYELCLKLVRSGGIIAFDNVLRFGKTCDPSFNDEETVAVRRMNDNVRTDSRVNVSMLDIGDGLLMAFKL